MSKVDFFSLALMAALAAIGVFLLVKSPRPFAVGFSAIFAAIFAALGGFPLLAYIGSLDVKLPHYIFWLLLALEEETMRFIFILLLFLRPVHTHKSASSILLAFGFVFGFFEFLGNFGSSIWPHTKCAELATPLSCDDGFYYLVIFSAEPLIFHVLICWAGYSLMDFSRKLSWKNFVVFAAIVVFHGATNFTRTLHLWGTGLYNLIYIPLFFLVLYAVMAVLSLRMRNGLKIIF